MFKMKMSPELFSKFEMLLNNPPLTRVIGHSEMRWRWDNLWAVQGGNLVMEAYREGLNDSHVDTALKRILGEEKSNGTS